MKRWLIALGVLALLVGLGYVARETFFEKTSVEVDRGYSGEAAYNPFFALRQLVVGLGAEARTVSGLNQLPPSGYVLVLAMDDRPLVSREVDRLLDWVEQGGHLIVPARPKSISQPFLEHSGVQLFGKDQADEDDHLSESNFRTERLSWPKLYVSEDSEEIIVRSDGETDASWALTSVHGEGLVTVPVSLRVLENDHLASAQHADLGWWLVSDQEGTAPEGVWIAFRQAPVSVWTLLAERARPVVLALALLCAAALALFARPFGPRLEPPPRNRRHLDEHLKATGRFLWDREVEHALLRAVQGEAERHLVRGGQPTARQIAVLVQQTAATHGLDAKDVQRALQLPSTRDPQQFTDTIHVLEQLRRKL